ncbi:hypothetical protein DWW25_06050, partial [Bacteroides xylanisolvens]
VITLKKATNSYPQEIAGEPEVGCTDAIVFGENYHSPVVIRDDNRGIPLGKVAGRYDWETNGNVKNADNEASSQSWIMFK